MMNPYSSLSDDFGIYVYLNTKMGLPSKRETILHFFDGLRKLYPNLEPDLSLAKAALDTRDFFRPGCWVLEKHAAFSPVPGADTRCAALHDSGPCLLG